MKIGGVADEKYMIGYEDNTFRPLRFIFRAEAVVTFDRAIEKDVEIPPVTGCGSGGSGGSGGRQPTTTPTAVQVTTASAIGGGIDYTAVVPLNSGYNEIAITVGNEKYFIIVNKEQ